ncbi:hypothetical protein HanIR_Chr01g0011801 [Helianthus annuus]|nr:hypothetical protein HanIR_Chr01g0011801 [Helianthus annuus]
MTTMPRLLMMHPTSAKTYFCFCVVIVFLVIEVIFVHDSGEFMRRRRGGGVSACKLLDSSEFRWGGLDFHRVRDVNNFNWCFLAGFLCSFFMFCSRLLLHFCSRFVN